MSSPFEIIERKLRDLANKVWVLWRERDFVKNVISQVSEFIGRVGRIEKRMERVIDVDGELKRGIVIRDKEGKTLVDAEKRILGDYGEPGTTSALITEIDVYSGPAERYSDYEVKLLEAGYYEDDVFNGAKIVLLWDSNQLEAKIVDGYRLGRDYIVKLSELVPLNFSGSVKITVVGIKATVIVVDPVGPGRLLINKDFLGRLFYEYGNKLFVRIGIKDEPHPFQIGTGVEGQDPLIGAVIFSDGHGIEVSSKLRAILGQIDDTKSESYGFGVVGVGRGYGSFVGGGVWGSLLPNSPSGISFAGKFNGPVKIEDGGGLPGDLIIQGKVDSVDISEIFDVSIAEGIDKVYSSSSTVYTTVNRWRFVKGEHRRIYTRFEAYSVLSTGYVRFRIENDSGQGMSIEIPIVYESYTLYEAVEAIDNLSDGWYQLYLDLKVSDSKDTVYVRQVSVSLKRTAV